MKVLISENTTALGNGVFKTVCGCDKGTKHSPLCISIPLGGKGESVHVVLPQGKWCTSSRESDNQTANVCSKTVGTGLPEPDFSGAKTASKGEFVTWLLSIFLEWVKKEAH